MILGRLGKGYSEEKKKKKKEGVRIFGENFWLGCFSVFTHMLEKVSKEQKQIFLLGDFNINLLNYIMYINLTC